MSRPGDRRPVEFDVDEEYYLNDYDEELSDAPPGFQQGDQRHVRHLRQVRLASSTDSLLESGMSSSRNSSDQAVPEYDEYQLPVDDEANEKYDNGRFLEEEPDMEEEEVVSRSPACSEDTEYSEQGHRNITGEDLRSGSQNSDDTNGCEPQRIIKQEDSALPDSLKGLYKHSEKVPVSKVMEMNPNLLAESLIYDNLPQTSGQLGKSNGKRIKSKKKPENLQLKDLGHVNRGLERDSDMELPSSPPTQIVVESADKIKSVRPVNHQTCSNSSLSHLAEPAKTGGLKPKEKPQKRRKESKPQSPTLDELIQENDNELSEELGTFFECRRKKSFRGNKRSGRSRKRSENESEGPKSPQAMSRESFLRMYQNGAETEDQLIENIRLQKEIIDNVRNEPWRMRKKLRTVRLAKAYVEKYEGRLSKGQGYQEAGAKYWRRFKREFFNIASFFVPWEMRIKKIESHFGSVVSSYFTFLRWLLWVNIVLAGITIGFIVIPEILVGAPFGSSPSKSIPLSEKESALNFKSMIDFEGYLKYSPIFYGYYGAEEKIGSGYRLPLAYFLAGLATYAISFIIVLRRMAKNSRASKLSSKDEQYSFSWRVYTGWDFMIGIPETGKNKAAEIVTSFRETILEEKEKKREENKSLLLFLRVVANILVIGVLSGSAYAIQICVDRSEKFEEMKKNGENVSAWESMEISIVMTLITSLFPSIFDLIGLMEKYHPRVNLRWQLARILTLYFLNLYTLLYALLGKIRKQQTQLEERNAARLNATLACNGSKITLPGETGYLNASINMTTAMPLTTEIYNCTLPDELSEIICWENMIGQEIFKLAFTDTWMTCLLILAIDCVRGLFVRFMNPCWCWDLERKFPEYGEFKIAENILHLVYNQATVWLGTFFVPVLPGFNVLKLVILLYTRSWAVLVCNIPHERVFKASKSNNFYYAISLLMLFLVTFAVGYLLVSMSPSSDCGPFRIFGPEGKSYFVLTDTMEKELPQWGNTILDYIASPGIVIPVFLLLVMSIYYLLSLTRSLKDANKDLRDQLLYERTEEKKKIYAMADGKKDDNGRTNGEAKNLGQGANKNGKNSLVPVNSSRGTEQSTNRTVDTRGTSQPGVSAAHVRADASRGRRATRVVRVPGMTLQQAAALKARNPNVRIMTSEEAARLHILPPNRGIPVEGMVVANRGARRDRPLPSGHSIPPIAVVRGKPLPPGPK